MTDIIEIFLESYRPRITGTDGVTPGADAPKSIAAVCHLRVHYTTERTRRFKPRLDKRLGSGVEFITFGG
jgi:hypothetical protein